MGRKRFSESSAARSWLAVKGKTPADVHAALRLGQSSLAGDDALMFQIVGAASDAGWYLIVAAGRDHRLIADTLIQPLSATCDVVTCTADESELFSAAASWHDGTRAWSVAYDGLEAADALVIDGDLPLAASLIRDRGVAAAMAEDAGDLLSDPRWEIAIEIVGDVTGYRPGMSSPAYVGRFRLLEGLDTPWWKRWTVGG